MDMLPVDWNETLPTRRTALVTGGTDGIGRAVAHRLAEAGHRVLVVGRDPARGAQVVEELQAAHLDHRFLPADLSSMAQTAALVERIRSLADRVDAVVCCAGLFAVRPRWTAEGLEYSFALDYLSRFLLVRSLLPDLGRSPSGRVVLVANAGRYRDTLDLDGLRRHQVRGGLGLAGATQFANDVLAVELADRIRDTAIEVSCVFPGVVGTELFRHAVGVPAGIGVAMTWLAGRLGLPPEVAAETPAWLAGDPAAVDVSGRFFGPRLSSRSVPARARDPHRRAEIWDASEAFVSSALALAVP